MPRSPEVTVTVSVEGVAPEKEQPPAAVAKPTELGQPGKPQRVPMLRTPRPESVRPDTSLRVDTPMMMEGLKKVK